MVRVRLEARVRRLLSGTPRRLRAGQHDQRAGHRSARTRRRGADPVAAVGVGPQGDLVGPQGPPPLLSGAPELAWQSCSGETALAHVSGSGVRRADGGDRPVTCRAAAAGDERSRHPAVARLADDRVDHRRRRNGDRRSGGTRRSRAADRCPRRRHPGHRRVRPRHPVAPTVSACAGEGLELRQPAGDGRRHQSRREGRRDPPSCWTRRGGSRRSAGPTVGCSSCSTSG